MPVVKSTTIILITLMLCGTAGIAQEDQGFSLKVRPSHYGKDFLHIQGYPTASIKEGNATYRLRIWKSPDSVTWHEDATNSRPLPQFEVQVEPHLTYRFQMEQIGPQGKRIETSEHSLSFTQDHFAAFKPDTLFQQAADRNKPSRSLGGQATRIEEIQCSTFPYTNVLVRVERNGQVVTDLDENNFSIFEDGLSPAEAIRVLPPQQGGGVRTADFAIVFDNSSSMNDDLARLRNAIGDFTNNLVNSDIDFTLGFVPYEINASVFQPLTPDAGAFINSLDAFLNNFPGGGTENAFNALNVALNSLSWRPGAQKVILLFTDEDDDGGGPSLQQIVANLQAQQATVYGIVEASYGASNSDFCATGSVTEATGGSCFPISSPDFTPVLNEVGNNLAELYILSYLTPNLNTNSGLRDIRVDVDFLDGSDVVVLQDQFDPLLCNQIRIELTSATQKLFDKAVRLNQTLNVAAQVTSVDPMASLDVTLHYRNANDASYTTRSMSGSGDTFNATLPGISVIDPSIDFFISVSDGNQTTTLPSVVPQTNPFQIAVLPNVAPQITHTPLTSAAQGSPLQVQAEIVDVTEHVDSAHVFYRRVGTSVFNSLEMGLYSGKSFSATIPAQDVVAPGLEYYLEASDNFGLDSQFGSAQQPFRIEVSEIPPVPENTLDVSQFRLWADQIQETASGVFTLSGNVQLGTVIGNQPLMIIQGAVEANTNSGLITNFNGPARILALGMRGNPNMQPQNIALGLVEFSANGATLIMEIDQTHFPSLDLFPPLMFKWSDIPGAMPEIRFSTDDQLTLSGTLLELSLYTEIIPLEDIVLSQSGNSSTGVLTINQKDLGLPDLEVGRFEMEDYVLTIDFIRRAVSIEAELEFGGKIRIPKTRSGNIEELVVRLDVLLSPSFAIDGGKVEAKFGEPEFSNGLRAWTIPLTPPVTFGVAPTCIGLDLQNLSGDPRITGSGVGALADALLINQSIKAATDRWPLSGNLSITVDLSGGFTLSGGVKILEDYELSAFALNYSSRPGGFSASLTGQVSIRDIFIGSLTLALQSQNDVVVLSGDQIMTIQIPQDVPYFGGTQLANQAIHALLMLKNSRIEKAEFTATVEILFWDATLRVDLVNRNVEFSKRDDALLYDDSGQERLYLRVGGYSPLPGLAKKQGVSDVFQVEVGPNSPTLVMRALGDQGTPQIAMTLPSGEVIQPQDAPPNQSNPYSDLFFYSDNPTINEGFWALNTPAAGTYVFQVLNLGEIGGFTYQVLQENATPEFSFDNLNNDTAASPDNPLIIRWQDNDPDNNATIQFFIDEDNQGADGLPISDLIREDDNSDSFTFTPEAETYGPYYVYARIDDGENAPVFVYSNGRVLLPEPPGPASPTNASVNSGDGEALLTWQSSNRRGATVEAYRLELQTPEGITTRTVTENFFEVAGLANGVEYAYRVAAIDAQDRLSSTTAWQQFMPNGLTAGGPPELEITDVTLTPLNGDMVQLDVTITNHAPYDAYGYQLRTWFSEPIDANLILQETYAGLAGNSQETKTFIVDLADRDLGCDLNHVSVDIDEVISQEWLTENNFKTFETDFLASTDLSISKGMEMLSLAVDPNTSDIVALLGDNLARISTIWKFDASAQAWIAFDATQPGSSAFTELEGGTGYLFIADQGVNQCTTGQPITLIDLKLGWNLVGPKEPISSESVAAQIGADLRAIWYQDNETWRVFVPGNPEFSDLSDLIPGEAYWLDMTADTIWDTDAPAVLTKQRHRSPIRLESLSKPPMPLPKFREVIDYEGGQQ